LIKGGSINVVETAICWHSTSADQDSSQMTAKTGETRDRAFKFSNELRSTAFETNIRSNSKMKRAQLRLKQNVQSSSLQLKEELPSTSPPEQRFKKTTARKQTKTNKFKSSPKKVARDI
jgi:hypothetical protein